MNWHPDMPDEYKNQIITGDARVLTERIPDESVDLIFTDPVYQNIDDYRWLAETAERVLRPDRACLVYCGIGYQEETQKALRQGGRPVTWILPTVYSAGNTPRFHPFGFAKWTMLLWAGGEPVSHFCDAQISTFEKRNNGHKWTKNTRPISAYLKAFTRDRDAVLDLYAGGGTIPAVCKMLSRNYIAFEIDPATAELARERVRNTQPPLFVPEPEQLELGIA